MSLGISRENHYPTVGWKFLGFPKKTILACGGMKSSKLKKHPPLDLTAGFYTKLLTRAHLWAEVLRYYAVASKQSLVNHSLQILAFTTPFIPQLAMNTVSVCTICTSVSTALHITLVMIHSVHVSTSTKTAMCSICWDRFQTQCNIRRITFEICFHFVSSMCIAPFITGFCVLQEGVYYWGWR